MAAAYAALVSLMNVIHDLQHHHSPPISLHHQPIEPITQHIIFFLDFLQDHRTDDDEDSADPLEMRIANAAYAAEDAIESHIVDTIQPLRSNRIGSKITWILSFFLVPPNEPINANDEKIKLINLCHDRLQSVIKDMDSIKNLVTDLEEKNKKKEMMVVHDQDPMKNVFASASPEETTVGLDAALLEIMEKLSGGESNLQIIPIVGMGGIGKTFLAKTIYQKPLIKGLFDICAWATISQQYNTTEILCEIFFQATNQNKEGLSGMSGDELGLKLRKFLFGRRFLIVLDDMWCVDAWDKTRIFFPNNENGSRVLVTTRLSQLSSQLNHDYSLHMSFLDKATSWDLFSSTVFDDKKICPLELKEIGEQIADNCRGLPLSIVVVGGILKNTVYTPASWKSILDNLSSMVNMENDKHCLKLLMMSYNHLPVYLKPCFLYMGVFKEDGLISVSMLIRLWVSEGFIKPSNDEAIKTTAREFMQELIDRNLILIHWLRPSGKIKYCNIHDLVRDLCLKEGQKDGLYHVVRKRNQLHPQQMNTLRRVVIPMMNTSKEKEKVGDDQLRSMSNARSVICQIGDGLDPRSLRGDGLDPRNLRLLRTLHARDDLNTVFLRDIHMLNHVNLRHLVICVRSAGDMFSFLHSVSLLWNLQTLVVSCSQKNTLLSDFWKMPQFRHIEFVDYPLCLPNIPSNEGDGEFIIMENLHTLKGVSNFRCCEGMVKRIPNIKKLRLEYEDDDVEGPARSIKRLKRPAPKRCTGLENEYFVENIKSLCRLESLFMAALGFSKSYKMQKLSFPQSLKKLRLTMNNDFEWEDMMERIGLLPLLETLILCYGCFRKGKWETAEGQFPCLKYLELMECEGLENWTAAEEGSNILPRLEYLSLTFIESLKKIPLELGNIDTLMEIKLTCCGGEDLVKCVKEMVDEHVESQGKLCFHVRVAAMDKAQYQSLKNLVGPQFEVIQTVKC